MGSHKRTFPFLRYMERQSKPMSGINTKIGITPQDAFRELGCCNSLGGSDRLFKQPHQIVTKKTTYENRHGGYKENIKHRPEWFSTFASFQE